MVTLPKFFETDQNGLKVPCEFGETIGEFLFIFMYYIML